MKRYLFLLALPLLFATCAKQADVSPDNPIIGTWQLAERLDSAGDWQEYTPPTPSILAFRADGSFDFLNADGTPQRTCCQPQQYTFNKPTPCPPYASCLYSAGTIRFDNVISCPTVKCAAPQFWTLYGAEATHLDVYGFSASYLDPQGRQISVLRYRRVR